ncbi:hypothetical protein BCR36DRAFT_400257 [Piromyces finnis]|uniref:Chitin-binding type-1 domain-containing protein n=1 Tax=Piromyces finnis TaxID=1754191 RepID=A0A1Y1UWX4_9FUNG|nr:hypothetical protein BCR36DRAFT_400257 [Piromyces finnis]|eukprot:ORX42662.1 hypothetical protein BCR36DRAFT_400257 [Piromyces finnis]
MSIQIQMCEFGDKCIDGKCGSKWGICPNGQCCSKKGYCGTTSSYCSTNLGCQSEFGDKCIDGRCGSKWGICPNGQCCSKKGYEFGECKFRCGKDIGACPNGQCCSSKGFCGTTSFYCSKSKGCQASFGQCL